MTPRLTHLALHVRDLPACVAFYRDYCRLQVTREREAGTVAWLAEPGREADFVMVLIAGGPGRDQADGDYSHLGFALDSKAAVDAVAARARRAARLAWRGRVVPSNIRARRGGRHGIPLLVAGPAGPAEKGQGGARPDGAGQSPEPRGADPERLEDSR